MMKRKNLEGMSVDQLVDLFEDCCLQQDRVLRQGVVRRHKRLFEDMFAITDELKKRGPAARLALTKFYNHPSIQVRLQAAKSTLAVAPDAARQVIQAISKSKYLPQAGDAGMCLLMLERGISRPE